MEKSSFTSSFSSRLKLSKIPKVLILSLLVILGVELSLCALPTSAWSKLFINSSPARDDALRFRAKVELIDSSKPKILLLGSSQMRAGVNTLIVAERIREKTGVEAQVVNLGTSGARSLDFFLQLRIALKKSPALVVIMPTWSFSFYNTPQKRLLYYSYSQSDLFEIAKVYGWEIIQNQEKRGYFIDGVMVNLLPSYRFVRAYSIFRILGRIISNPRSKPRYHLYRGVKSDDYFERQARQFAKKPTHPHPKGYRDEKIIFNKTVKRVLASGAKLIVVDGPTNPRMNKALSRIEPVWLRYHAMVKESSREHGFTYLARDQLPKFGPEEFFDVTHVNWSGRRKLSELIAKSVLQEKTAFVADTIN